MLKSILSRYLDPEVLSHVAERAFEPRGLVIGNLAGAHKSPLSGFAVEFAGHREYVAGDDPKHIDWRDIKGLSMSALAEVLDDAQSTAVAQECLLRRFPQVAEWGGPETPPLRVLPTSKAT